MKRDKAQEVRAITCEDCGECSGRLRSWKYEPAVKLCEDCREKRIIEESEDE